MLPLQRHPEAKILMAEIHESVVGIDVGTRLLAAKMLNLYKGSARDLAEGVGFELKVRFALPDNLMLRSRPNQQQDYPKRTGVPVRLKR
jgi:hypothetical protein